MIVDIFIPCYIDQYFPSTAMNMVKVLEKAGCGVNYNVEQTCCGMPAFRDGYWDYCKDVGTKLIHEFQDDRYIVSPGGSCVSMIKNYYPEMFHNSMLHNEYKNVQKNIYDFSDFLVNILNITDMGAKLNGIATYHDACSALRELKIKQPPRILLEKVKGLTLVEMESTELCCGWGGTFATKQEQVSAALAEEKVKAALKTGAEYIISTDMGCLMHIESYAKKNKIAVKPVHIADVIANF